MSTLLESLGIGINRGYSAKHLVERPELVVIGNAVSRDNAEAQEVFRAGIPFLSLPQALGEFLVGEKRSVVVAGTHGKTTTTSLLAWVLAEGGLDPSFFVGGVPLNFGGGFKRGDGPWVVMEGDEYDSAFFDKGPKFLHYRPQIVVLTSVEFDHADIYRDLAHVKSAFQKLIEIIPREGQLLVCSDYADALDVAQQAGCAVSTYGSNGAAAWQAREVVVGATGTSFVPYYKEQSEGTVRVPLIGRHNVKNSLAVYAIGRQIGLSHRTIARAMARFKGVKRRQELKGEASGITVLDDFAHHPTAVADTIRAVREAYRGRHLWAIFEPRSQTSRRRVFLKEFAESLGMADRVIIAALYEAEKIPADERLSPEELVQLINAKNSEAVAACLPGGAEIVEAISQEAGKGDVVLIMSNGSFGGLPDMLLGALEAR